MPTQQRKIEFEQEIRSVFLFAENFLHFFRSNFAAFFCDNAIQVGTHTTHASPIEPVSAANMPLLFRFPDKVGTSQPHHAANLIPGIRKKPNIRLTHVELACECRLYAFGARTQKELRHIDRAFDATPTLVVNDDSSLSWVGVASGVILEE